MPFFMSMFIEKFHSLIQAVVRSGDSGRHWEEDHCQRDVSNLDYVILIHKRYCSLSRVKALRKNVIAKCVSCT